MLTQFSVKNYKCLADVTLPLTPIHVLIGQNDTGKTSLLEAIQLGVKVAVNPNLGHDAASLLQPAQPAEALWHMSNSKSMEFGGEIWSSTQLGSAGKLFAVQVPILQISHGPPKQSTIGAYSYRILRFRPKIMAKPSASNSTPQFDLQTDGFGLATLLDEITGYDVDRFVQLQKAFREFFPQYQRIMLSPSHAWTRQNHNGDQELYQQALGKEVRLATEKAEIRLSQASDGVILLLGFLALTYSPNPPNLLLIEEPENGVHPKRLIEVAKLLRRFAERVEKRPQIIMTTHSPWLLSEFQPQEVTLMRRQPDGSAKAFPLRDAKHLRERMGDDFYLGEMWYNLDEEDLLK